MVKSLLKAASNRRNNVKNALAYASDLKEQLQMAGLVQRDFLPKKLPDSEKLRFKTIFLPAEWVSGDIYDVARLDEEHIGFYVADVVGHGMPAALLTIFLKQAIVMRQTTKNTYRIFQPSEVMKNLNLRLTEQKFSGQKFITCCYCLLNINTLNLTYARAGHPYPILIRKNSPPQRLESQGSLLGIFEESEFPQQSLQLQPDDKLLLYSDGAEPYIGTLEQDTDFRFNSDFCNMLNLPIAEMVEKLENKINYNPLDSNLLDDITAVALQVL
jgi:sigma-B regulation protein RsbU (phosphoserine phosphatase)